MAAIIQKPDIGTVNHLMGAGPFLRHFPIFALLTISLGAPPGSLENASIAGLTFTTNLISPRFAVATPVGIVVCPIYFIGVSVRFSFQRCKPAILMAYSECRAHSPVSYHTIMNHSYEYSRLSLEPDYQGITLLMWGATVPLTYCGFKCGPKLQKLYWFLLSAIATACSIMAFQTRFRDAPLQRTAIFGCLALSTAFPALHNIIRHAQASVFKYPEKRFPRRFDIFGASHQIPHIVVVLAGLAHTFSVLQAFDFLHKHGDTCIRQGS